MSKGAPHIDHELIARYLAEECSPAEAKQFEADLLVNAELKAEYEATTSIWDSTEQDDAPQFNADKAWDNMTVRLDLKRKKKTSTNKVMWLAAAGFVLFVGLTQFMDRLFEPIPVGNVVLTAYLGSTSDTLPDGTIVTLNEGGEITYKNGFDAAKRTIHLTGEAYFEVTPDPNRPFTVMACSSKITCFGTSFLVKTYCNDSVTVHVDQGSVQFTDLNTKHKLTLDYGTAATWRSAFGKVVKQSSPI